MASFSLLYVYFAVLASLVGAGAAAGTITLASAFVRGGETTLYAQTIAKYIEYHSGLKVNLTFVTGANGGAALHWLAEQPADGLHIATAQTPFVVTQTMLPGLTPYTLMVHVNASYTTWPQLLVAARAAGGLWAAGVSMPFIHRSITAQCPEAKWLRFLQTDSSATNIKLLRNRSVAAIWASPPLYMMNRDLMRPIAVGADVTPEAMPRVPLFSQFGIDVRETLDRGLAVSSRLPEDVKRRLSGWIGDAAANVSFIRELQSLGFLPRWIAYPQTTQFTQLKYAYYHALLFPDTRYDYTWVAATAPSVAGLAAVLAVVSGIVAVYCKKRRKMFEQFEESMSKQALQRQSPATTVLATLLELKKFVPAALQPRLTETTQLLVSASLNKVDITKGVDREAAVFFKALIGIDCSGSNESTADDASMSTCSAGLKSSALAAERGEPWSLRHYDAVVASGDKYFSWNYDPREADRECEGHALQAMLVVFFERMGLLEAMRVERGTLCRWAEAVEDTYAGGNPFHSQLHAADVVQCVGYLVALPGLRGIITPQQAFLCIVAAAAHDCGHPGRTNAFVVESRGELAMTYNDRSVLENHHLATFFRLCAAKRQNIFGGVPDSEYRSLRRRVIEMVLATDLAGHFAFVDNLSNKLACADLSNSARPWEVSEWWTQQISEEFFQQGDEELRRGFKVSAFMDRRCPRIPRSQVLFIDNIQMKIWKLLSQIEPVPELIELIQKNRDEWDLRDRRVSIASAQRPSPADDAEEAACHAFLAAHMPARDRGVLLPEVLNASVLLALQARHETKWAAAVPLGDFLRWVLPYASLDEARDNWRPLFHEAIAPVVRDAASLLEAYKAVNTFIWDHWDVHFVPQQTPMIRSPFEAMAYHRASCTGMSIFLVDALRSVGIPARVAGTPDWNTDPASGNHNWVEVLVDGYWSFTEFEHADVNHTWFVPEPAKFAKPGYEHGIWAAAYERQADGKHFPMSWALDDWSFPGIDVTDYYLALAH
eukprot:m51a1_g10346 putative transglutaminase-like protein (999) ;mRNA; f:160519-166730